MPLHQTSTPVEIPEHTRVETFSLPSSHLTNTLKLRMDASHFNATLLRGLDLLNESGMQIVKLDSIVSSVFMPSRFRRIYVDEAEGLPFLQGSHVVQFRPTDVKFLSKNSYKNIDDLVVKAGWIFVTRSGTVGRITICPQEWDGWTATEDIIRILPDEDKCPSGYLYAFLASALGQIQLTTQIHGAVIDHLTEQNVKDVLVPIPTTEADKEILRSADMEMRKAVSGRSEASVMLSATIDRMPKPKQISPVSRTEHFSLPSPYLDQSVNSRMDASSYSPALVRALQTLQNYRMPVVPLGTIVSNVFMPPRFKRIYVEPENGYPFLQGSHVVHFQPAGIKYLSTKAYSRIDEFIVKCGWIFVTRSGTVGRITICPQEWDGWTATEDIIRILPDEDKCPSGYLYAFLASALGQIQLTTQIHGAVIDHLTEQNVKDVLVPVPKTKKDFDMVESIDEAIKEAFEVRSRAVTHVENAVDLLKRRLSKFK